jgi:ABC-2 type transport system ATP-binding protein
MKYLIKVSNFSKKYKTEEVIIKDILITNRITLLLGKNGSGKSTLLRAIGGFIKYIGNIQINGKAAYMSEFTSFPTDLTMKEFIYSLNNVSKNKSTEKEIENLFKLFNLSNKTSHLLSSLSKGMKAKINLVQVLIEKSDIYLLDEPINGLDKDGVKCLINYLEKSDKNFVISTHLIDDFKNLKSEVVNL